MKNVIGIFSYVLRVICYVRVCAFRFQEIIEFKKYDFNRSTFHYNI